ncbi:helix-turn-helix domain-containing protein [Glutamicibacter sp. NPDC087344]|uniref:helix-turn-helix domain-containing protein n=1 Tax=Glutamicibacter sp. NPDC087344 TaxID=3363994 RepID=UPI003803CC9F
MADLGRAVAARRRNLGLNQTEMAAELGLTQRYVSELETGKTRSLSPKTFDTLDQLGIRLSFRTFDE